MTVSRLSTQIQDLHNKINSLSDAREFSRSILSPRTLSRCDSGLLRDTQNGTGITGNVLERPYAQEGLSYTIFNNDRVKSNMLELAQEERSPGLSQQQQCVRFSSTIVNTMTGKRQRHQQACWRTLTDEVNKIGTVLNNGCQFKIPVRMLNRNSTRHHHSPRCHGQGVVQQREGLDG